MELEFEIDYGYGFILKPPPVNWKGLVLKLIFTAQQPNATLEGTDFEWMGINAKELGDYIDAGISGGIGIGEGPGLRIYGCAGTSRVRFMNGYIDLGNERMLRECDKITAPSKETGRVDWLADIAASITFAYLHQLPVNTPGRLIPSQDFKLTPYCITEIPNYTQVSLLAVSIFLTIREARDIVKSIQQCIQELTGAATATGMTLGLTLGLVVAAIAKVIIYVVYLTAIILALVNMIKTLIANIIQQKKSKACMLARTHFIRACQYFGLNFSSTILNLPSSPVYNDTWIPAKSVITNPANPLNLFKRPQDESIGFPNNPDVRPYFDGNFRDFIVEYCNKYNAEIAIIGNTLYFEEAHYFNLISQIQIPATGPVGNSFNYPNPYGTNYSELPSNYLLIFATDISDLQTIHRYQGTSCSVTVSPNVVHNIQNLSVGPAIAVRLTSALAKRKEYLSQIELNINLMLSGLFSFVNLVIALVNGIINVINWVIGIFGGSNTTLPTIPQLPVNILNNRIGWMELTGDTFNVPKTFIGVQSGQDWKISAISQATMNAEYLSRHFHWKNLGTRGNQQKKFQSKQFHFCCEDFVKLLNKNGATSPEGLPARFVSLDWHFADETARDVDYRVFDNFTNNLKETIVIDGAQ